MSSCSGVTLTFPPLQSHYVCCRSGLSPKQFGNFSFVDVFCWAAVRPQCPNQFRTFTSHGPGKSHKSHGAASGNKADTDTALCVCEPAFLLDALGSSDHHILITPHEERCERGFPELLQNWQEGWASVFKVRGKIFRWIHSKMSLTVTHFLKFKTHFDQALLVIAG